MHDLSLHLLDLLENSLQAGAARIRMAIEVDEKAKNIMICVEDDGRGFSDGEQQVIGPFYTSRPHKKTGLGLSLLRQTVHAAGGQLSLSRSKKLRGASVSFNIRSDHLNRPPLGDLAATISTTVLANPALELELRLKDGKREYGFRLSEFVRKNGLRRESNVHVAAAVHREIKETIRKWKKMGWMDGSFDFGQVGNSDGRKQEKEESINGERH